MAISANISSMYYMESISTFDQHVYRCLWRNLEIDREQDTYIKTVLKFGDLPSPAMAIVALHRTTKLMERDAFILKAARIRMAKQRKNTRHD